MFLFSGEDSATRSYRPVHTCVYMGHSTEFCPKELVFSHIYVTQALWGTYIISEQSTFTLYFLTFPKYFSFPKICHNRNTNLH